MPQFIYFPSRAFRSMQFQEHNQLKAANRRPLLHLLLAEAWRLPV